MKTMKQIADDLGIDKQRVYRFIKDKKIKEVGQEGTALLYDEAAEKPIKKHFESTAASPDTDYKHINNTINRFADMAAIMSDELKIKNKELDVKNMELDIKNKQIEELSKALSDVTSALRGQQALHHETMQ